jgi:hypothetical protein
MWWWRMTMASWSCRMHSPRGAGQSGNPNGNEMAKRDRMRDGELGLDMLRRVRVWRKRGCGITTADDVEG